MMHISSSQNRKAVSAVSVRACSDHDVGPCTDVELPFTDHILQHWTQTGQSLLPGAQHHHLGLNSEGDFLFKS